MTVLLNILAIPLGLIALTSVLAIIALIIEYFQYVLAGLFVAFIGYAIGINIIYGLGWL